MQRCDYDIQCLLRGKTLQFFPVLVVQLIIILLLFLCVHSLCHSTVYIFVDKGMNSSAVFLLFAFESTGPFHLFK